MIAIVVILAVLMGAGAVSTVFHGGEKEGICQYGYNEDEEDNNKSAGE